MDNANDVRLILKKYTGELDIFKIYNKGRYKKIYKLGILGIGVLAILLKIKK